MNSKLPLIMNKIFSKWNVFSQFQCMLQYKYATSNTANGNCNRYNELQKCIAQQLEESRQAGTFKVERVIHSAQQMQINSNNKSVLNFCANNYLGLSNDKEVIQAAKETMDKYGFGMSSVRFICGTQDIHLQLEKAISKFYNKEDTILYSSCFDANAGFFEAVYNEQDAVISDSLNHASIIDGIRLCKAQRFRYEHLDMASLEEQLQQADKQKCRFKLIVTDGAFSMDGDIAPLDKIVKLAQQYKSQLFVDDCHATGFLGPTGQGSADLFGVINDVDVVNGTLGKSLGGASGGYTTGRKEIIALLRQKSRPYLFSNSIAPPIVGASLKVMEILQSRPELRMKLKHNTQLFRGQMKKAGFAILGHDECPIAPVYIGDAKLAGLVAEDMFKEDIYVIAFSFPVVPKGKARIRVQLSAAHTDQQINKTVAAFIKVGAKHGLIKAQTFAAQNKK